MFTLVRFLIEDRKRLMLENVARRQQLAVLKRSVNRPKIEDSDRIFWILMRRMLKEWKETLHFVKPTTVVAWHRRELRCYWRRKSKSVPGSPPIDMELINLIRRISMENVTWVRPRSRRSWRCSDARLLIQPWLSTW